MLTIFFNKSAPDILEFGLLLIVALLFLLGVERLYSWNKIKRAKIQQALEESCAEEIEKEISLNNTNQPPGE